MGEVSGQGEVSGHGGLLCWARGVTCLEALPLRLSLLGPLLVLGVLGDLLQPLDHRTRLVGVEVAAAVLIELIEEFSYNR